MIIESPSDDKTEAYFDLLCDFLEHPDYMALSSKPDFNIDENRRDIFTSDECSEIIPEKLHSSEEIDIESSTFQEEVVSEANFTIQTQHSESKLLHAKIIKSPGDRTNDMLVNVTSPSRNQLKKRPPSLHYRKEGYELKQLKTKRNCLFFLAIALNKHDSYLVCCDGEQFTEILLPPLMNGSKPIPFTMIHKIMNNKIQLKNCKKEILEINMETCSENIFDLDTADEGSHINFYQNKEREQINEHFKIILRNNTS